MSKLLSFASDLCAMRDAMSDPEQSRAIMDMLLLGGPHTPIECDDLLESLDVTRLSPQQVLSLLTCTQHVRDKLTHRDRFIDNAVEHWIRDGMDPDKASRITVGFRGTRPIGPHFIFPNGVKS